MTQPHTHYPPFPFRHSDVISTRHMPLHAYQHSVCIPTCILLISPKYLPYLCISNIPSHRSFLSRPPFLLFSSSFSSTPIPINAALSRLTTSASIPSYCSPFPSFLLVTIFRLHRYIPLFPHSDRVPSIPYVPIG